MGGSASTQLSYSEKLFSEAVSSLEEDRLVAEFFGQPPPANTQTTKVENTDILTTNTHISVTSTELQQRTKVVPALEDSSHTERDLGGSSKHEENVAERHIPLLPRIRHHIGLTSFKTVPSKSKPAESLAPDKATTAPSAAKASSDRGRQFPHTGRLPKSNIEPSALLASSHLTQIEIRPRKRGSTSNPYICPFPGCGQTFSRKAHLASHAVGHSSIKKYACEVCGFPFARSQDLKRHKETEHGIVVGTGRFVLGDAETDDGGSNAFLKCPDCGARCKRQMSLRRHMQDICKKKKQSPPQMEDGEQQPYPTPVSGQAFESSTHPFAGIFQSQHNELDTLYVEYKHMMTLQFEPSESLPGASSCSSDRAATSQSRFPPPFLDAPQNHLFQTGARNEERYASLPPAVSQNTQMQAHPSRMVLGESSGRQKIKVGGSFLNCS
ncbi:hypothetical protein HDU97_009961 [Phlyctochytrium planicorne]|nr:hypothetical protein HDU97_009961 [Phlyctochytrium planicorne]